VTADRYHPAGYAAVARDTFYRGEESLILATTTVEDFDRFLNIFSTGFQNFLSDPEVPPIIQEAGHKGRPQPAAFGGQYDS
jgi:hypothetical protein